MEILNNPEQAPGLDNLFAEYGQPAEITQSEKPPVSTTVVDGNGVINTDNVPVPESIWRNNPLYFQTGKKAGQKRPVKNNGVSVSIAQNTQPTTIDGSILSGALFLTIVDMLFPLIIVGIHNSMSKKKISTEHIQLSKEQRKQLEPVADKVAAQLQLTANPTTLLFWTMLGLYAIQYATARMLAKEEKKNEKGA